MKKIKKIFTLVAVLFANQVYAQSQKSEKLFASKQLETQNSSSLIFDPKTKKYFFGGNSKFILRRGEEGALIERIEISVDGGEYQPYDKAIEFKQEGKHNIKFKAINPVNNWTPVQFLEVFVDLTPAVTEAKWASEDKYFKDGNSIFVGTPSQIILTAQDNLSGVATIEFSWDGNNFIRYTKPISVEKSGQQSLYYRSIDRVGNLESVKKMDFTLDNNEPVSEIKLGGETRPATIAGKTYISDGASFTITATDDSAQIKQIWVVIDGKEQIYIKPIYFLDEGPHTLSYYSVDNVGNKEAAKTMSFYTVSNPPQTLVEAIGKVVNTGGINYVGYNFQLKLHAKDNIVGVDRIEVKIDSDPNFSVYMSPIRFNTLGMHTITYRAIDRTGNAEPTKTYSLNLVNSAPETTISTAQPLTTKEGITYSPAPNIVTFNVKENHGVGVEQTLISINDGPFTQYKGPLTLDNETKFYKISYKSVDRLGNIEPVKSATFRMISSIPMVDLFVSDGKSAEEQVRTNYLDQPAQASHISVGEPTKKREPSNIKSKKKKDPN